MRFQQVKRSTNNILRKESIKNWIVKSALGLVGGLVLFGVSQSTVTQATTDTTEQPSIAEITPETVTKENEPTGETTATSGNWGVDWKVTGSELHISGGKLNDTHYAEGSADNTNQWGTLDKGSVTKIVFDDKVTAGTSISGLFNMFTNVTEISGLDKFDTSKTTDMSYAFANDNVRTEIDVSSMDVSKVSNFSGMFYQNFSLQNLDISKWNWSSGIDFHDMFSNCESLETLELPSVSNISGSDSDFTQMFYSDVVLKSLDLSNLDMSKTDKVDRFIQNSRRISTLVLSSKNNLTKSQIEIKSENDDNPTMGISGWKKDGNSDINANNEELTTMYDGKKDNGKVATWTWNYQPYISFTIRYVDENTGKHIVAQTLEKRLPFTEIKPEPLGDRVSVSSGYARYFNPESFILTKDMDGNSIDVKIPKAAINFYVYEGDNTEPYKVSITKDNVNNGEVDFKGQLDKLNDKEMILSKDDTENGRESYIEVSGKKFPNCQIKCNTQ